MELHAPFRSPKADLRSRLVSYEPPSGVDLGRGGGGGGGGGEL